MSRNLRRNTRTPNSLCILKKNVTATNLILLSDHKKTKFLQSTITGLTFQRQPTSFECEFEKIDCQSFKISFAQTTFNQVKRKSGFVKCGISRGATLSRKFLKYLFRQVDHHLPMMINQRSYFLVFRKTGTTSTFRALQILGYDVHDSPDTFYHCGGEWIKYLDSAYQPNFKEVRNLFFNFHLNLMKFRSRACCNG